MGTTPPKPLANPAQDHQHQSSQIERLTDPDAEDTPNGSTRRQQGYERESPDQEMW
jgi:hypothetical protein